MKRLEGDVLEVLADLGGQEALAMETDTVHPRNFLGLELNPRAAAIAELVLWLGYLQWQMRNKASISDPVLEKLSNRSEEHTSELQSLMRISYAVFRLKKTKD